MATKTLYVLNTTASSPGWFGSLQDGGTAPTAANTSFGLQTGKLAVGSFGRMRLGATAVSTTTQTTTYIGSATGPTAGSGSGATTAGDSFRVGPYTGNFASGNWSFSWVVRPTTATIQGRINMRVWRSANADGSSATEITSGKVNGSNPGSMSSTTTDYNSSITWAAPSITLNNEYLFFQLEYEELVAAGTANGSTFVFRVGTAQITTTNFANAYTITCDEPAVPIPLVGKAVSFVRDRPVTAAQGSYALTGKAVGFVRARTLIEAQGSYTLTGKAATLTYTPSSVTQTVFNFKSSLPSGVTFARASTASYFGSDGLLKINGAASGAARIDYDPVTKISRGLLVEEQRTNSAKYSNDFSNATWGKSNCTVTQNVVGPDGLTNSAWTMTENTSAGIHRMYQSSQPNSAFVASIYVKDIDARYVYGAVYTTNEPTVVGFDLQAGKVTGKYIDSATMSESAPPTITPIGNGWFRLTISLNVSASSFVYWGLNSANAALRFEPSYTGTSKSAIFFGAQSEVGSYPTSYIGTTSAAVTRAVDSAVISGTDFSSWFNITVGTFVVTATPQTQKSYTFGPDVATDVSTNNRILISTENGDMRWLARAAGGSYDIDVRPGNNPPGNPAPNYQLKVRRYEKLITAFAYASNDYAACMDGGPVATDSTGTFPTGMDRSILNPGSWIERIDFFNVRKTNAELQALTLNPKVLDFSSVMPANVTFTRASIGTYFGDDGLLKTAATNKPRIDYDPSNFRPKRTNLLSNSNDINNSTYWGYDGATVTDDATTSPDGSVNACKIDFNAPSGSFTGVYQSIGSVSSGQVGQIYTVSAWVKADAPTDIVFGISGDTNVNNNRSTLMSIDTNWKRLTFTSTIAGADTGFYLVIGTRLGNSYPTTANIDTSGARTIYIYGAQFEAGAYATSYIPTVSGAVTVSDPFTLESRGLLIEPQRTNTVLCSDFVFDWGADHSGTATATSTFNTGVCPDGTTRAVKIDLDRSVTTDYAIFLRQGMSYLTYGANQVASIYFKAATPADIGKEISFCMYDGNRKGITNIKLTDSWVRYATPAVAIGGGGGFHFHIGYFDGGAGTTSTGPVSFYAAHAQVEEGDFATSFIPNNTGSGVTRAADSVIMVGTNSEGLGDSFKDWYNDNEGTFVVDAQGVNANNYCSIIEINNNSTSVNHSIWQANSDQTTNGKRLIASLWGSAANPRVGPTPTDSAPFGVKSGFVYKDYDNAFGAYGSIFGTDTTALVSQAKDRIYFGYTQWGVYWAGHIKKVEYYPKRRTNAELQALTLKDQSWNFTKQLPEFLTRSRASSAMMFGPNGYLINVPTDYMRLTTDPVTLQPDGLLVEPQATNLLLQSNAFTTTWSNFTSTGLSSAAGTSPDGTNNAWKHYSTSASGSINGAGATSTEIEQSVTVTTGNVYAASIFLRAAGNNWYAFGFYDHDGDVAYHRAWFNLSTGVVGTKNSGITAYMTDCGGGWYRCIVLYTKSSGTILKVNGGPVDADASVNSTMSGTNGALIYGAQMEVGWQGPTSYIPTTTAQVTRSADLVYFGGDYFTSFWNAAAGTLVPNFKVLVDNPIIGFPTSGGWHWLSSSVYDLYDGTNRNVFTIGSFTVNGTTKIAAGFDASGSSASENGAAAVNGSNTLPSIASMGAYQLWFGYNPQSTGRGPMRIRSLDYYSTRKTNSELVALSSVAGNAYSLACDKGTIAFSGKTLVFVRARTLALAQGTRTLTGQTAAFVRARTAVLAQGSGVVTGQATAFVRARTLVLAQGTRPVTGQAAILAIGRHLIAAQGTPAFAGQSTAFVFARKVAASLGTETLTGQAVGLKGPSRLTMGQGAFVLSGQQAQFVRARQLALAQGTQAVSGQSASFIRARTLALAQGTNALTGQTATFVRARTLLLAQGTRTLAGQTTALVAGRKLALAQGSQILSGQVTGLAIGRKIATAQGTQAFSGQAVGLIAPKRVQADLGSLVVAGRTAGFVHGYQLGLAQGALATTGRALAMVRARQLLLGQGASVLTGQALILTRGRQLALAQGTRTVTGQATVLYRGWQLLLAQGTRTVTGQSVAFVRARQLLLAQGTRLLTGQATGLAIGRKLISNLGTLAFAGNNVTVFKGGAQSIDAIKGTIALAGQSAILAAGHKAILAQGANTVSGQQIAFVKARQLVLSNRVMALSGQTAAFVRGRQLALARGNLTTLGQTGIFLRSRNVQLAGITALFAGQTLGLAATRKLVLAQGTRSLTGTSVALRRGPTLLLSYGSSALSGKSSSLVVARKVLLNNAAINLSGKTLTKGYGFAQNLGTLTFSGIDSGLRLDRLLNIGLGSLTFNGRTIGIIYVPLGTYQLNLGTLPFVGLDAFLKYRKAWYGPVSKSTMFIRGKKNVLMIRRQ